MTLRRVILLPAALVCGLGACVAFAQKEERTWGLAGDLAGKRTEWADKGVVPFLNYTADALFLRSGGFGRGESFQGDLEFGADLDLETLANWKGASLHVHGMYLHGDDPSADLVGDFNYLSNIVAEGGLRLYQFSLSLEREDWAGKVGIVSPDDDFAVSESSELFVNSAFGVMPSLSCNSELPIWPRTALGIWGQRSLGAGWTVQAGVYDGAVPDDRANRHGTRFRLNSSEGAIGLVEVSKTWSSSELNGLLKAGAWYHTGDFFDHESGETLQNNHGFHLILEQSLASEDRVRFFARAGLAPRHARSTVRLHRDVGFTISGVIPGRTDDVFGVGWFRSSFSPGYLAGRWSAGEEVTAAESGIEITYAIAIRPGLTLQPDFQYIMDPHESGRDATVAILRLYAEF